MTKQLTLITFTLFATLQLSAQRIDNVITYGAKGDGKTNDARAIQQAIDACSKSGGGRVLIPAGRTFMASPFNLKSNIDLHLAKRDERRPR